MYISICKMVIVLQDLSAECPVSCLVQKGAGQMQKPPSNVILATYLLCGRPVLSYNL